MRRGTYSVRATLTPGTYTIAVSKGGYDTAREANIYLLAGSSLVIDELRQTSSTFSSLQTIASVRTGRGGGVFNTLAGSGRRRQLPCKRFNMRTARRR